MAQCKNCRFFTSDMMCNGKFLGDRGDCLYHNKPTTADDECYNFEDIEEEL